MTTKIGARELQLREQRERQQRAVQRAVSSEFCTYPRCKCVVSTSTSDPEPECKRGLPRQPLRTPPTAAPEAPKPKESDVRKASKAKPGKAKASIKTKKRAAPAKAASPKKTSVDRTPLAVGHFIVAAGDKGVSMEQMTKKFAMEGHPLRSKIHAAKHQIGFAITYHADRKVYTGTAPATAQAA